MERDLNTMPPADQPPKVPPRSMPKQQIRIGALRADIQFIPPGPHGPWALLFDPVSEAYYKLSERSCSIMRLMDQTYEFEAFLERVAAAGIETEKEEVLEIVSFLEQNSLTAPEYGSADRKHAKFREMMEKSRFLRIASMYLFFRLPPVYPDRFFSAAIPYARLIFNRYTIMFLVIAALAGYILLIRQWNEACVTFLNSLSWAGLVSYFWALLVTKSVHELSHGFTAKSYGVRVRAMGVSFIVFYPRLFVDLTDTWRLPRHQRLLCDSAGIISELIFGGIAAAVWVYASPGPLKSTMFYLFAVSTLGTLLVNGNPFIRYDGYYILTDLLNIENLMSRSSEYLKAFNRKLFLGIGSWPDAGDCSGTALYLFGFSAFIYRFFLYTSIILLVYFQFAFAKPVAIVMMFMEIFTMVLIPLWRELQLLTAIRKRVKWGKALISFLLLAGIVSLFFIPLPWSYNLPCEIVPAEKSLVVMKEGAFSSIRLEDEPRNVKKGDLLLPCRSPLLDFGIRRSRVAVLRDASELDLLRSDTQTIGESTIVFERLKANRLYLEEMLRRKGKLNVVSPADGIFIPLVKDVVPGRWLEKGSLVGEIVSPERKVYAYARDNEVNRFDIGDHVVLRLRDSLESYSGRVASINPVAVKFRDSTLILQMGGSIACHPDPKTKEFSPVNVLYAVTVEMDRKMVCPFGRTGQAKVEKQYILAAEISRAMLHVFFREFTF